MSELRARKRRGEPNVYVLEDQNALEMLDALGLAGMLQKRKAEALRRTEGPAGCFLKATTEPKRADAIDEPPPGMAPFVQYGILANAYGGFSDAADNGTALIVVRDLSDAGNQTLFERLAQDLAGQMSRIEGGFIYQEGGSPSEGPAIDVQLDPQHN